MSDHFARVEPIIGWALRGRRVGVLGLPEAAPLVQGLAASGIGRWWWPDSVAARRLVSSLRWQHGAALSLSVRGGPWEEAGLDLLIGVGPLPEGVRARARACGVPLLHLCPPSATSPCQVATLFPDDPPASWEKEAVAPPSAPAPWPWITSAPLGAGLARAMLLRGSAHGRADMARLWARGVRWFAFDGVADPFAVRVSTRPFHGGGGAPFQTPVARRGRLLIVGLGSLGSVAATHLAPLVTHLVLVDPDRVEATNPVRQAFGVGEVGQPKALALAARLRAQVPTMARVAALRDEAAVAALIAAEGITGAVVATGTAADFAIARALRAAALPHVVGRCYPRARYWEAMLIPGREGPSLSELRGHLALGPLPPATPEQRAAYSEAGALEAEPATLLESGWAAAWLARLVAQQLAPPGLRERWFLECASCLIGGVGVEATADGPAYGIDLPGMVRAWGAAQIRGVAGQVSEYV